MLARKALLVDDSKSARFVLSKLLQKHDFEVEMVDSAEAALDFLASNQPDAIFMDHLMKGMDGLAAMSKIKTDPSTAHIPVVMCTSNDGEDYLREAKSQGALGTLIKPPSSDKLEEILTAVEQAIGANQRMIEIAHATPMEQAPGADNIVTLPLGGTSAVKTIEMESGGSAGLELEEIEDSVAALIAQKLRKFEQTLEDQSKRARQELLTLVEERLAEIRREFSPSELQTSISSRLEAQSNLFEARISELKKNLGAEVMGSATVSRQVQEIARETAIEISEETAKAAARNMGQRAAREAIAPELDHKLDQIRNEFTQLKQEVSGRAAMYATVAAAAGVAASIAVYFLMA